MVNDTVYPLIDVAGSPGEIGLAHGRQLKARIHATIAGMRENVGPESYDASWEALQETVSYCRQHAPDLMEEMEAIAQGADADFRDVFKINAQFELYGWNRLVRLAAGKSETAGCSSHAVVTDSEVLLGWNGDDWKGWLDCGAVIRGRPHGSEPFIYWSLAGTVGRPGMNRHLALGANGLPRRRWRPEGLLYPMISRQVLACRSAQQAFDVITTVNACSAMNYLIADQTGVLLNVERTADGFAVQHPENQDSGNYLLHTNCYLDSGLAGGEVDRDAACPRLAVARRLYHQNPPVDVASLRAILSDHSGADQPDGGICFHSGDSQTIVSFVAALRAGRFHVTCGSPCKNASQTYSIV